MSRFLTPSKLCLLVLIDIYRDEALPLKSTIPVLSFISSHIIRRSYDQTSTSDGPSPPTLKDFETLLSPQASNHPGRSLYETFVAKLWELDNLVVFSDFLANLTTVTHPTEPGDAGSKRLVCSPTSPIGQFTRRCHLESVRLQFSDAYNLWESFVVFREPTKLSHASRNPANASPKDDDLSAFPLLSDRLKNRLNLATTPSSLDDVEKAMHFQLSKLQKYGTRVPDGMKQQLERMTSQGGSTPSEMHFIKYVAISHPLGWLVV